MTRTLDAILLSWPFDPWLLSSLAVTALIYLRGWRRLRRRDPNRWKPSQPIAFLGGLATIFLALASPIEPFASLLLRVHMLQHLLLMMAAPPLIWLGYPLFPLLLGLPRPVRRYWVEPLFRNRPLRGLCSGLVHPLSAWILFVAATWLWHVPRIYELALRSPAWHYLQHVCFLGTALLFWYPVVRPYPCRPRWSLWLLVPYLLLADLQNTALSALFTFSEQPLYPYYTEVPGLGGFTAVEDQAAAGVLMWVPGSLAYLLPLFAIALHLLFGSTAAPPRPPQPSHRRVALPLLTERRSPASEPSWDLLRVPLLGGFLRWRYARLCLQLPLLLLAGVVVVDGLRGPQITPLNLAGVLPWVHWRGLLILGLLVAGNVFCTACPFLLPRTLARHWLPARHTWPRLLRSKWIAIFLLVLFLWAYEVFALWDSPWWTAWLVLAYFAAALVIDGFFRGAAFCKYLCPIGQFNFVQALVSFWEFRVRDLAVCRTCTTKDCIRGRPGLPGCELNLYLPRKAGNMDCTACLDCVHACPHDNIGVLARAPASELWQDAGRSGIGKFSRRPDLAALVAVLVFGAFINAAGMVGPVVEGQEQLAALLGLRSSFWLTTFGYALGLIVLPFVVVASVSFLACSWGRLPGTWWEAACRFTFALVPLGFGMWLTHYGFHFLTSFGGIVLAGQRFLADLGWMELAPVEWTCNCCLPVAGWLIRLEILFLDLGLLLSLYTAYRIAASQTRSLARTLAALAPWVVLLVLLFALGVWIVFQPMQMRGTMQMVG